MNEQDFAEASSYWDRHDADTAKMDRTTLKVEIEQYIVSKNTCALATGWGGAVRCTPVEYGWHDGAFWIFTEGGHKFDGLAHNTNVGLAIFDPYDGFGRISGLQVTGRAAVIEPFSPEYLRAAACKKIPEAALRALPHTMHLLRITPVRFDFLRSAFKDQGFASRQSLVWAEE